jgi:hypothetical protein
MHFLLLKIHNKTNLKYLCKKTTKDEYKCYTYKGSGVYWKKHLKKHGNNVTTIILERCKNVKELRRKGLIYSNKWNVVNSIEFANLTKETGNFCGYESLDSCLLKTQKERYKKHGIFMKLAQQGKTMKDRMGSKYIDPRKGKKWEEIYRNGYKHSQIKPFKITCITSGRYWVFDKESDFQRVLKMYPDPTLRQLKRNGTLTILHRKPSSQHPFNKGDILKFEYI